MATKKIPLTPIEENDTLTKRIVKKAAVKKAAPKKAAVKKAVAKPAAKKASTNKRPLVVAPTDRAFWMVNGEVITTLLSLAETLARMEPRVYYYHVHDDQHDFALWVEHVLGDAACAVALRSARTPKQAEVIVAKHLKRYAV